MGAGITLDTSEWTQAVAEYAAAGHKTAAQSANHAIAEIFYRSAGAVKDAEHAAIEALTRADWWPKFIAKHLTRARHGKAAALAAQPVFGGGVGYLRGAAQLAAVSRRQKSKSRKIAKLRHYTIEDAREFSNKIIGKRIRGIRFVRLFFIRGFDLFKKYSAIKLSQFGKKFSGFDPYVIYATEENPNALAEITYLYAHRGDETGEKTEAILQGYLDKGAESAYASIRDYIAKKMWYDAAAVSARVAA